MTLLDEGTGSAISSVHCDLAVATAAARAATNASRRLSEKCSIVDKRMEEAVPRIFQQELVLGGLLGTGSFSNVYEVARLEVGTPGSVSSDNSWGKAARHHLRAKKFLAEHCIREKSGQPRYAVKFLKREAMADARRFRIGAADLALEARLLSSLEHPNIVKIRGISAGGVAGFATGAEGGFFIMMDRLYDTLEQRIEKWKKADRGHRGLGFLLDIRRRKRRAFLAERLNVAFDIAGALKYLHSRNIIFRDLKPENSGFDGHGDVKIFDFGLAKELDVSKELEDGTYKMTGNSGSLRYMAPEVALSNSYNLTADIYSFGTMLWEMMALETPYHRFGKKMHTEMVVKRDWRPTIPKSWPFPIRSLIKRSWSSCICERPNSNVAYDILRDVILGLRNGDETGLEHLQRRSTHVLQGSAKQLSPIDVPSEIALAA